MPSPRHRKAHVSLFLVLVSVLVTGCASTRTVQRHLNLDDQNDMEESSYFTNANKLHTPRRLTSSKSRSASTSTSTSTSTRTSASGDDGDAQGDASPQGPCKGNYITIPVYTAAHFALRSSIPATVPVTLVLQTNITLPRGQGLILNQSFACTRIISSSQDASQIEYPYGDMPAVTIASSSNIWIQGVSVIHGANNQSGACGFPLFRVGRLSATVTCPGVYILKSFGVQITGSSILGRVQIFRSIRVLLDQVTATTNPGTYDSARPYRDSSTRGVIVIGQTMGGRISGSQPTVQISNSEIYGAWELISLLQGAAGVLIANNKLRNFEFTAIRCGLGARYSMDCQQNTISRNFIWNPRSGINKTDENNAGVYLNTKWFNPGNSLSCNMIFNQRYCYRLAGQSSGVAIRGGNCVNTDIAVQIDTGKFNTVKGLSVKGATSSPAAISCSDLYSANCFKGRGNNWEALRRAYYQTKKFNQTYPYLREFCDPVKASMNNVQCNPPMQVNATVAQTGYCSSLPYSNSLELFLGEGVNPPAKYADKFPQCGNLTINLNLLNYLVWHNLTQPPRNNSSGSGRASSRYSKTLTHVEPTAGSGGLPTHVQVPDSQPKPIECPWSNVGPGETKPGLYRQFFNISEPLLFPQVVAFNLSTIMDLALVVPVQELQVTA